MLKPWALAAPAILCAVATSALADTTIETVYVTAQRRPEDIQKVPITVTALSANYMREQHVKNALDLQALAPGLTVVGNLGSADNAVFSIRGQNQPFGGADPGVQTYFAEVPFGAGGAGNFFDLDNVQVLEGPQGTLFGRNTTGGAILFEPKRPVDRFEAFIDAQGGDSAYGEVEGALNVPIVEGLLDLRVAGDIARRNGYTRDISFNTRTDDIDFDSGRVGLSFTPTSDFNNYTVFQYEANRTHGTGNALTAISTNPAQLAAFQNLAVTAFTLEGDPNAAADGAAAFNAYYGGLQFALANQQGLGPRATTSTIQPFLRRDTWDVVNISEWQFADHMRLRNIFGYISDKKQPGYDYDGSFLPVLEIVDGRTWQSNSIQLTDELQLQAESDDNLWHGILGYYYEADYPGGYSEIQRSSLGGAANAPLGAEVFQVLNNEGDSNAVFAQITYDASQWINGLSLTAGGRYTFDRKVATESDCAIPPAPACPFPIPPGPPFALPTQVGHFSAPTWTLTAAWQATDDAMAYVTTRRGYKSGGFNSGGFGLGFKPEYLTDVEVGVRHAGTLFDFPMVLNADAYYGWYEDVQKNDFTFVGIVPIVATFNAAKATIKGVEMSAHLQPTELLDLSLFYAYTDASYGVFNTPFSGNHSGDPFAFTPRNKLGTTARVRIPVDPAWGAPVFAVTWNYQSKVWFSDFADVEPDSSQGAYSLVNLRLDWNGVCGSRFDAAVFVNNVGDTVYKVGANPLEHLTLTTSSMFGPPRLFGVELRYSVGG